MNGEEVGQPRTDPGIVTTAEPHADDDLHHAAGRDRQTRTPYLAAAHAAAIAGTLN
jgi:hypothetical protein